MHLRSTALAAIAALLAAAAPARAQQMQGAAHGDKVMSTAAAGLTWSPIQPPGFDAGMQIAVVRGDPAAAGKEYVIRLSFPDGYRFPPHWHPVDENLTVLEGEFLLAMGERADESRLQRYLPGDFIFADAKKPHFGGAKGRTVIQLHGAGPFDIIVVGSAADKR